MTETTFEVSLLKDYKEAIRTKGVVVLKNIFSKKDLDELTDEFDKNWHEVQKKLGQ